MAYPGSVDLISGIRQKNNGKFPLVHASAVQVGDDPNNRLDLELQNMKEKGMLGLRIVDGVLCVVMKEVD